MSENYQDLQIMKEPNVESYIQGLIEELSVKEVYQAEIEIEDVLDYLSKKGDQFGELSGASFRHNKDNFIKVNLGTSILYDTKKKLYSYNRWKKIEKLVLDKAKQVDDNDFKKVLITGIYGYNNADYNLTENRLRHKKCREILYRIKKDPEDFFNEALNKQAQRKITTFLDVLESYTDIVESSDKINWQKIPFSNDTQNGSKRDSGWHKENKEWVVSKWKEERQKLPSANQTDFKIQDLYEKKFGFTISTSQIQRYTGRQ